MHRRLAKSPKSSKPNAVRLWAEIEDHLVPALALFPSDRVVYFYLVRHSRLAGRRIAVISARSLTRATHLSRSTVRTIFRRLVGKGVIRILDRNQQGFRLEVNLPREIPGCVVPRLTDGRRLDALNFYFSKNRRCAIYRRENHRCFYCLRRLERPKQVLDHVVPQARAGKNSYRNLVACCLDCNMAKRERPARHLLRRLYRNSILTAVEFKDRLRALTALRNGNLKPDFHL